MMKAKVMTQQTPLNDIANTASSSNLHKNSQAVKKGAAIKNLGEKSCEIKGGSHVMLINFNNA